METKTQKPHLAIQSDTKDQFDKLHMQLQGITKERLTQDQALRMMVEVLNEHPELLDKFKK